MEMPLFPEQQKAYKSIILAGAGSVGRSLLKLGQKEFQSFAEVLVLDRESKDLSRLLPEQGRFCRVDVQEEKSLRSILSSIMQPALFVNLCAGIDNVNVRRIIAEHDMAYIDSCCCAPDGTDEVRFSRMMPYSLSPVSGNRPQWLCWGINPGLVELISRKLMAAFKPEEQDFEITVFEHDQMEGPDGGAVGWCPEALIEEIVLSPSLEMVLGEPNESPSAGARKIVACWNGRPVDSRLVGHEDVWTIGQLPTVARSRFVYALQPQIMKVLDQGFVKATALLRVPPPHLPVYGKERVAVHVRSRISGEEKSMVWEEDHHRIWQDYGLNAVQYQTAKALLLAVSLLQQSRYGILPGNFCAADLPITSADWQVIDRLMVGLGIDWQDISTKRLRVCPQTPETMTQLSANCQLCLE